MSILPGHFIVLEGTDGSGKATQTALLTDWLQQQGHEVANFAFPRYGQSSAYFVEQYLAGHYGPLAAIDAYRGSLFYALDRFEASAQIRQALEAGKIVISDRYVGSNMGHQGSKIMDTQARHDYYRWNQHLEFDILGNPKPHLNIVLNLPAHLTAIHLAHKSPDLHEAEPEHLQRSSQTYLEICELFPHTFTRLDCFSGQDALTIETVQSKIRELILLQLAKV